MMKQYITPAATAVKLTAEDILTISTLAQANDAEVDQIDFIKIIF